MLIKKPALVSKAGARGQPCVVPAQLVGSDTGDPRGNGPLPVRMDTIGAFAYEDGASRPSLTATLATCPNSAVTCPLVLTGTATGARLATAQVRSRAYACSDC